ncbi:MAG: hypothetical protein R3F50_19540 [Gammaproteobacteria bacterium]|jgi:hypothetical protein
MVIDSRRFVMPGGIVDRDQACARLPGLLYPTDSQADVGIGPLRQ